MLTVAIPGHRVQQGTRIFKELPYFGVKSSNIHPALESGFLPGTFLREGPKSTVMYIPLVMVIFLLFLDHSWGETNYLRENQQSAEQYIKTQK